jgi:hypothetical protein
VPIGFLPEAADAVESSLDEHFFDYEIAHAAETEPLRGGTPTRSAVAGALEYIDTWSEANPEQRVVMVLATDGDPQGCDPNLEESVDELNTVESVAELLFEAVSRPEPVMMYVIGIGIISALERFAEAGGTGFDPFAIDGSGSSTEQDFIDALEAIRANALPCNFDLPEADDANQDDVDPNAVNVDLFETPDQDAPVPLYNVEGPAACADHEDAWFYSNDAKTELELCPETCSQVTANRTAKLTISLGCQTRQIR